MMAKILLTFIILLTSAALQASECREVFVAKDQVTPISVIDVELALQYYENTKQKLKQDPKNSVLRTDLKKSKQQYVQLVSSLFTQQKVKFKFNKKTEEFLILPIKNSAVLNEIAWLASKKINTRLVFSYKVSTENRAEAMFVESKVMGRSRVYIPVLSLFIPANHFLAHELTHAEIAKLIHHKKAYDFRIEVILLGAKANRVYNHLPAEEFITFSDEVVKIIRGAHRSANNKQQATVEDYSRLEPALSSIDLAIENHQTFKDASKHFSLIIEQLLTSTILFTQNSHGSDGLLYIRGGGIPPLTRIYLARSKSRKDQFDLFFDDMANDQILKVPFFGRRLVREFNSMLGHEIASPKVTNYAKHLLSMTQKKIQNMQNYVTEVESSYKRIQGLFHSQAALQEFKVESENLLEISRRYLDAKPIETKRAKILP